MSKTQQDSMLSTTASPPPPPLPTSNRTVKSPNHQSNRHQTDDISTTSNRAVAIGPALSIVNGECSLDRPKSPSISTPSSLNSSSITTTTTAPPPPLPLPSLPSTSTASSSSKLQKASTPIDGSTTLPKFDLSSIVSDDDLKEIRSISLVDPATPGMSKEEKKEARKRNDEKVLALIEKRSKYVQLENWFDCFSNVYIKGLRFYRTYCSLCKVERFYGRYQTTLKYHANTQHGIKSE